MDGAEENFIEDIPIDHCSYLENFSHIPLLPGGDQMLSIHDILADKLESELDKGMCCPNELTNNNEPLQIQIQADRCYICNLVMTVDEEKYYIFSKNDQEIIKQSFRAKKSDLILSKLICIKCLDEYYTVSDCSSKNLTDGKFLVVKNNSQIVYELRDPNNVPQMATANCEMTEAVLSKKSSNLLTKTISKKSRPKSKNPAKSFQCHICLKRLNDKSTLRAHIKRHESVPQLAKIFSCSKCKLAFKDLQNAQDHVNEEECNRSCRKVTNLDILPACTDEKLKLIDSDNNEVDALLFDSNLFLNEISEAKIGVEVVEISQVYICEYCDRVYCEKDSLRNHTEIHKGLKNPYKCFCGRTFPTYSKCTRHRNSHKLSRQGGKYVEITDINVDIQNEKFPVVKLFLCEMCEMSFFDRNYYNEHKKMAHSQKAIKYKCEICDEIFCSRFSLGRHNKKHHKENNRGDSNCDERPNLKIISTEPSYHCTECGNAYFHSTDLRTHTNRLHKREATISCPKCNKMFYEACDMEKHLAIHMDQRPFSCGICDKAFRNKNAINEHAKVHSNERPFSCDICGMTFKRSRAVKNHRSTHAKKRHLKCTNCQHTFKNLARLKSHMQQCGKSKEEEIEIEVDTIASDPALNMNTMFIDTNDAIPISDNAVMDTDLLECSGGITSEEIGSVTLEAPQDIVYIQDDLNIADGSLLISYENEFFSQMHEGDYLIFNDNAETDAIWNN